MKVKELIESLKNVPQEWEVMVRGYEGDAVNPVSKIAEITITDIYGEEERWIFGRYDVEDFFGSHRKTNAIKIVGDYSLKTSLDET